MATTAKHALNLISGAPRSHLFTRPFRRRLALTSAKSQNHPHRNLSSTHSTQQQSNSANPFSPFSGPSPPRLPKEEQDVFESLQRQSTGAFSTPRAPPQVNQSPDSSASASDRAEAAREIQHRTDALAPEVQTQAPARAPAQGSTQQQGQTQKEFDRIIEARGKGEELHPNVRRGATPEFEGDVNPKTGEVGGPKNEPLRWGAAGEWSYNGRTTDF